MSRVLIWRHMYKGAELDIFRRTEYSDLYQCTMKNYKGIPQNWGNRLWFQGIYSAIDTGENTYDFLPDIIDYDVINKEYDFIILSMANIFHTEYVDGMKMYAKHFENIRIPVYVIACGVQANSYDVLDDLIAVIGTDARRFIRSVYNTGGEFALRGYFTKEFFERLGFHSAVVTGCPSMYQLGPDFQIENKKLDICNLHPVFNGQIRSLVELMYKYPDSVFIDQDTFFYPLFQPDYLEKTGVKKHMHFFNAYGIDAAKFLSEGRILQFADMNVWWNYLQQKQFNYSFGSRIHGTIMSLLSGIPATIITMDSRTQEMAEFFDIPNVTVDRRKEFSLEEFHKFYYEANYTSFNKGFRKKFENYEKFLVTHGIVSHINSTNEFLREEDISLEIPSAIRKQEFAELYRQMQKKKTCLQVMSLMNRIKGKILL